MVNIHNDGGEKTCWSSYSCCFFTKVYPNNSKPNNTSYVDIDEVEKYIYPGLQLRNICRLNYVRSFDPCQLTAKISKYNKNFNMTKDRSYK